MIFIGKVDVFFQLSFESSGLNSKWEIMFRFRETEAHLKTERAEID